MGIWQVLFNLWEDGPVFVGSPRSHTKGCVWESVCVFLNAQIGLTFPLPSNGLTVVKLAWRLVLCYLPYLSWGLCSTKMISWKKLLGGLPLIWNSYSWLCPLTSMIWTLPSTSVCFRRLNLYKIIKPFFFKLFLS